MWPSLCANDANAVLTVLAQAFEDNDASAAAVGVDGDVASIVVLVPRPDVLPERRATVTRAGNLSLKHMTKTEAAALYLELVTGYLLVTAKEAFAVAPRIEGVRMIAVRPTIADVYGRRTSEAVLAVDFRRSTLRHVHWSDVPASRAAREAGTSLAMKTRGQAHELVPFDLDEEPEIADVLDLIDHDMD